METKICTKCGRELPLDMFNWRNKAKGTRRADCKECHSGYMKQKYQENKEIIGQMKANQGCAKCGDTRSYVLDYHHIDPSVKTEGIARMVSNHYTSLNEETLNEIKKCVVLCANCHREWHYLKERDVNLTFEEYINN